MIELIDDIETGHTTSWYQIEEVAKLLRLKTPTGKNIGRNLCFKVLKFNGALTANNTPKQTLINLNLAIYKTTNKNWKSFGVPYFNENGIQFLKYQFASGKYVIQYDKTPRKKRFLKLSEVC